MRPYLLASFVLIALAPDTQAAGFDCTKAATAQEKMICSSQELSALDSALTDIYQKRLAETSDPRSLKAEQRNWIRNIRDRCADISCLRSSYGERLQQLRRLMTNKRVKEICQTIVMRLNNGLIVNDIKEFRLASETERKTWQQANPDMSGLYLHRMLEIDYDGDNKVERLGFIQGGGTCHNCDIVNLAASVWDRYPSEEDDEEERLRWASWGRCDHFLMVDGEPIVITGNFGAKPSEVTLVSWFGDDGAKRALCYLGKEPALQVKVTSEKNRELCRAVIDGRAEVLPWSVAVSVPLADLGQGWTSADSAVGAALDIDLDGDRETIALVGQAFSGGCGSYHEWLAAVSEDGKSLADSKLNEVLRGREWGPLNRISKPETRLWTSARLFRFAGKPYVLAKGRTSDAEVVSLWGGEVRTWCTYELLPQHKVEVYYPRPN